MGAFAAAALLASLAIVTLLIKKAVELNVALRARRLARRAEVERRSLAPAASRRPAALSARPNESRA